jgi:hypothetical protein
MYQLDRKPWMQKALEHTQLYQIISIQNDTLRYEARSVTGELRDAFELVKQRNGINRLVEKGPVGVAGRVRVAPKTR